MDNTCKTSQVFCLFVAVSEVKFCGIIDQSLFYIDLTVYHIQNFEKLT